MLSVYQPNMKLFASSSIFTIYFAIMMVRIVVVNNNKSMVVVHGHGYIVNPISRNYYSHLHGLPSPEFDRVPGVPDAGYCYHCLNTKKAGSVCGTSEQGIDYDAWLDSTNNPMPWNHNGNIYQEGAIITFESYLQSHHTGHLELKACNKPTLIRIPWNLFLTHCTGCQRMKSILIVGIIMVHKNLTTKRFVRNGNFQQTLGVNKCYCNGCTSQQIRAAQKVTPTTMKHTII